MVWNGCGELWECTVCASMIRHGALETCTMVDHGWTDVEIGRWEERRTVRVIKN